MLPMMPLLPGAASWVVAFRQLWRCACAVIVVTTFIICVLQMNWESHAGVCHLA